MLEFEAFNIFQLKLIEKFGVRYDNLQYTLFSSLPCQLMKFSIRAEFLDTKLLVFTLPKAFPANTSELINAKTSYNYCNFGNFNPRAI